MAASSSSASSTDISEMIASVKNGLRPDDTMHRGIHSATGSFVYSLFVPSTAFSRGAATYADRRADDRRADDTLHLYSTLLRFLATLPVTATDTTSRFHAAQGDVLAAVSETRVCRVFNMLVRTEAARDKPVWALTEGDIAGHVWYAVVREALTGMGPWLNKASARDIKYRVPTIPHEILAIANIAVHAQQATDDMRVVLMRQVHAAIMDKIKRRDHALVSGTIANPRDVFGDDEDKYELELYTANPTANQVIDGVCAVRDLPFANDRVYERAKAAAARIKRAAAADKPGKKKTKKKNTEDDEDEDEDDDDEDEVVEEEAAASSSSAAAARVARISVPFILQREREDFELKYIDFLTKGHEAETRAPDTDFLMTELLADITNDTELLETTRRQAGKGTQMFERRRGARRAQPHEMRATRPADDLYEQALGHLTGLSDRELKAYVSKCAVLGGPAYVVRAVHDELVRAAAATNHANAELAALYARFAPGKRMPGDTGAYADELELARMLHDARASHVDQVTTTDGKRYGYPLCGLPGKSLRPTDVRTTHNCEDLSVVRSVGAFGTIHLAEASSAQPAVRWTDEEVADVLRGRFSRVHSEDLARLVLIYAGSGTAASPMRAFTLETAARHIRALALRASTPGEAPIAEACNVERMLSVNAETGLATLHFPDPSCVFEVSFEERSPARLDHMPMPNRRMLLAISDPLMSAKQLACLLAVLGRRDDVARATTAEESQHSPLHAATLLDEMRQLACHWMDDARNLRHAKRRAAPPPVRAAAFGEPMDGIHETIDRTNRLQITAAAHINDSGHLPPALDGDVATTKDRYTLVKHLFDIGTTEALAKAKKLLRAVSVVAEQPDSGDPWVEIGHVRFQARTATNPEAAYLRSGKLVAAFCVYFGVKNERELGERPASWLAALKEQLLCMVSVSSATTSAARRMSMHALRCEITDASTGLESAERLVFRLPRASGDENVLDAFVSQFTFGGVHGYGIDKNYAELLRSYLCALNATSLERGDGSSAELLISAPGAGKSTFLRILTELLRRITSRTLDRVSSAGLYQTAGGDQAMMSEMQSRAFTSATSAASSAVTSIDGVVLRLAAAGAFLGHGLRTAGSDIAAHEKRAREATSADRATNTDYDGTLMVVPEAPLFLTAATTMTTEPEDDAVRRALMTLGTDHSATITKGTREGMRLEVDLAGKLVMVYACNSMGSGPWPEKDLTSPFATRQMTCVVMARQDNAVLEPADDAPHAFLRAADAIAEKRDALTRQVRSLDTAKRGAAETAAKLAEQITALDVEFGKAAESLDGYSSGEVSQTAARQKALRELTTQLQSAMYCVRTAIHVGALPPLTVHVARDYLSRIFAKLRTHIPYPPAALSKRPDPRLVQNIETLTILQALLSALSDVTRVESDFEGATTLEQIIARVAPYLVAGTRVAFWALFTSLPDYVPQAVGPFTDVLRAMTRKGGVYESALVPQHQPTRSAELTSRRSYVVSVAPSMTAAADEFFSAVSQALVARGYDCRTELARVIYGQTKIFVRNLRVPATEDEELAKMVCAFAGGANETFGADVTMVGALAKFRRALADSFARVQQQTANANLRTLTAAMTTRPARYGAHAALASGARLYVPALPDILCDTHSGNATMTEHQYAEFEQAVKAAPHMSMDEYDEKFLAPLRFIFGNGPNDFRQRLANGEIDAAPHTAAVRGVYGVAPCVVLSDALQQRTRYYGFLSTYGELLSRVMVAFANTPMAMLLVMPPPPLVALPLEPKAVPDYSLRFPADRERAQQVVLVLDVSRAVLHDNYVTTAEFLERTLAEPTHAYARAETNVATLLRDCEKVAPGASVQLPRFSVSAGSPDTHPVVNVAQRRNGSQSVPMHLAEGAMAAVVHCTASHQTRDFMRRDADNGFARTLVIADATIDEMRAAAGLCPLREMVRAT